MTFRELPLWMRIWVVLALIILVIGLITCSIRRGTSSRTDIDY